MIPPPLEQQHRQPNGGERAPEFHVRPLHGRGGDAGVFTELQFITRTDVAFGGVEQVGAEGHFIRPGTQVIDALLRRIAEDEFICSVQIQRARFAVGQFYFGAFHGFGEREAERVTGFDEELGIFRVGGIEPIHGVGDEDRERYAQRPVALQRIEAHPNNALPAQVAREDERRLRRFEDRDGPRRRARGKALHDLHVVEPGVAQQRVRGFPIHDHWRLPGGDALDPVRVHGAKREHVALGPRSRHDAIEHDEIKSRARVGQIIRYRELHIRHGAQGFFEQPITARDEQYVHRLGQQTHDGRFVVGG